MFLSKRILCLLAPTNEKKKQHCAAFHQSICIQHPWNCLLLISTDSVLVPPLLLQPQPRKNKDTYQFCILNIFGIRIHVHLLLGFWLNTCSKKHHQENQENYPHIVDAYTAVQTRKLWSSARLTVGLDDLEMLFQAK